MAKSESSKSKLPLIISLVLVAAVLALYFFVPEVQKEVNTAWQILMDDDQQRTQDWVSQFGAWGPIVVILCMIFQMFLIVVPTPILMVAAILAYGPYWGSVLIIGAIFCASSIGYAIGRYFGADLILKLIGEKSQKKIEGFIDDYGFWAVIVTRLSPFLSNDAISFVGGILKMGYWKFIGATLLGITPLTIFIAYLGENSNRLQTGLIWGSVVSIVLFALYIWWDKKWRNKD